MSTLIATEATSPNIAFIKYWGDRDSVLRIPANGSISMNLAGLETRTCVVFDPDFQIDRLVLNGAEAGTAAVERVQKLLDRVRQMAGVSLCAQVTSANNFPTGAGIASSAAAFAALSLAASAALGLTLSTQDLSRLARTGSGSACRSIPEGFVEWQAGSGDEDSYAYSIARPGHWELVDCVAVISTGHKPVGSSEGHRLANTSPLQAARLVDAPRRLEICRRAIQERDFSALAEIIELDSNLMHAVMQTSTPALFYWEPATLQIMRAVRQWRQEGIPAGYTIDAGPNVHVITTRDGRAEVEKRLLDLPGVERVLVASPGFGARLVDSP